MSNYIQRFISWEIPDPVIDFINRNVRPLGSLSLDISKQCYNFFFVFAFSLVWANLKSPTFKHILSVLGGLVVILFDFGLIPALFLLAVEISTYALLLFKKIREHPVFVMIYAFFFDFLALLYYYFKNYGEWRMDICTPIMLYVQKASSLAWNMYDFNSISTPESSPRKLSNHLKNNALEELPSFFHYLSYMLFPVTINLGPSVEYKMYVESVNSVKIHQGNKRFIWVGQSFLLSLIFLTYYMFPTNWSFMDQPELRSAHRLPYRIVYAWVRIHWNRFKYYGPWMMTNAFVIICGIGYEDGSWEHAINLFVGRVEFARRVRDLIANWNCGTQRFLKYYVYVRGPISPKTGRVHPVMTYVTNICSALWHGWYAGYLVTFGTVIVATFIEKWYYAAFPLTGYEDYEPYGQLLTKEEKEKRREERKRQREEKERKEREVEEREKEKREKAAAARDMEEKKKKLEKEKEDEIMEGKKKEKEREKEKEKREVKKRKGMSYYIRAFVEWVYLQAVVDYGSSAFFVLTWDNVKKLYGFVDYCGTCIMGGLFLFFFVLSFFAGKRKGERSKKESE